MFHEFYEHPSCTCVSPDGYSLTQEVSPSAFLILGWFYPRNRASQGAAQLHKISAGCTVKGDESTLRGDMLDVLRGSCRWGSKMAVSRSSCVSPSVSPALVSTIEPEAWVFLLTHTYAQPPNTQVDQIYGTIPPSTPSLPLVP